MKRNIIRVLKRRARLMAEKIKTLRMFRAYSKPETISEKYDYSLILKQLKETGNQGEYLYHLKVWKEYNSKCLVPVMIEAYNFLPFNSCKVADVAAGYGFWSLFFTRMGCTVTAIDDNSSRIDFLKKLNKSIPEITPAESDIRDMRVFGDQSFDMSFCANTLHVVPDYGKAVLEMSRITRRGGFLMMIATNPLSNYVAHTYSNVRVGGYTATSFKIRAQKAA